MAAKATVTRVQQEIEKMHEAGIPVTVRNLHKRIGGSYTTISEVLQHLEKLAQEPFDLNTAE